MSRELRVNEIVETTVTRVLQVGCAFEVEEVLKLPDDGSGWALLHDGTVAACRSVLGEGGETILALMPASPLRFAVGQLLVVRACEPERPGVWQVQLEATDLLGVLVELSEADQPAKDNTKTLDKLHSLWYRCVRWMRNLIAQ